jgi:hypothetical protein
LNFNQPAIENPGVAPGTRLFCVGFTNFWDHQWNIEDVISIRDESVQAQQVDSTYYLLVESIQQGKLSHAYRSYLPTSENSSTWADWYRQWANRSIRDCHILSAFKSGHEEMMVVVHYRAERTDRKDPYQDCLEWRFLHVLKRGVVNSRNRLIATSPQEHESSPAWLIEREVPVYSYPRKCEE